MEYFQHIRARLPFPQMQEHCGSNNLPTAQGWDKLQEKLEDESELSPQRRAEIIESLTKIFRETISVGTRAVRLFRFEPDTVAAIAAYFAALTAEDSPFIEGYPRPLSAHELSGIASGVYLCDVGTPEGNGSITLVLCGRRIVEEREPRTRAQIGDEAINRFGWEQYDEFVLVKRRYVQSYEVVRLDVERALLELRVEDHSGVDSIAALGQLQQKTNELLAGHFGLEMHLVNPVNLFPAIRAMYDDVGEGIVVELGFTTETGSAKHEKMRSNRADLRRELFHVGGKAAVNNILTPFRVAVRWADVGQRLQEEALLPGSIRQLGSTSPYLDHVVLSGSLTEAKMQATIQRVVRHLPT